MKKIELLSSPTPIIPPQQTATELPKASSMRWEYTSLANLSDAKANELGLQGWEAYAVFSGWVFFKRRIA